MAIPKRKPVFRSFADMEAKDTWVNDFVDRKIDYNDIPRFTTKGMNQAEFIRHILACAFYAGISYGENKHEKTCAKTECES